MHPPQKPGFLDLRSQSTTSVNTMASRPLRSPRLHVAGEAPPELSPLDAFALQSRLLAKQLEDSAKSGNRLSRLPPLTTASPLVAQGRSAYFRSLSYDAATPEDDDDATPQAHDTGLGQKTEVEDHAERPVSMHPRMSRIPPTPDEFIPLPPPPSFHDFGRGRQPNDGKESGMYFGGRTERSPSPIGSASSRGKDKESTSLPRDNSMLEASIGQHDIMAQSPRKHYQRSEASFDSTNGLIPPRTLFPKRSSSIMSVPLEPTDEESCTNFHAHGRRKPSGGSGMPSPAYHPFPRSPSVSSEMSAPLPRPSFNFSRPLSRAGTPGLERIGTPAYERSGTPGFERTGTPGFDRVGTPGLDRSNTPGFERPVIPGTEMPARQASSDSHASFILADETAHTPVSMHSEGFPETFTEDGKSAAPSYIYSKFALPRGKSLQRSPDLSDEPGQLDQPPISVGHGQAPPSPPTRPSSSSGNLARPSFERSKLSNEVLTGEAMGLSAPARPSTDGERSSEDVPRGRTLRSGPHEAARGRTAASTTTSDSASTIKPPRTAGTLGTASEVSADDHVDKAIALHEKGSLNESTYHLRLAARQGHPTGMLLYALACRHGWGMRQSPKEGAEWLRKAAECASVEIADDEALAKEGKQVDFVERKTRKAQFALSIYELGVSYINGWGIEQDKSLALRCFEIAGSWGDVDALAEAGFCYAQGIGTKKNLKKSARFYRQAEAKGMSMVGNSWIHKAKYNEDDDQKRKHRSKSRTRNIFGMKHNT